MKKQAQALKKNNKSKIPKIDYGIIQMDADNNCPFLTENKLCDIVGRVGYDKLGWVCKGFPKKIVSEKGEYRLSISLACPETARLWAKSEDALDLYKSSDVDISGMSGQIEQNDICNIKQPYLEWQREIRQVLELLCGATQYPINARVALMLHFAADIDAEFSNKVIASQSYEDVLNQAIDKVGDPLIHPDLVQRFLNIPVNAASSFSVIQSVITFKSQYKMGFNDYVLNLLRDDFPDFLKSKEVDENAESYLEIFNTYVERQNLINQKYAQVMESYFDRFIRHTIFEKSYAQSGTLLDYMREMLITFNVFKFFFFMNASLKPLIENTDLPEKEALKVIQDTAAKAAFQGARTAGHLNQHTLNIINRSMIDNGYNSVDKLFLLAR